MPNRSTDALFQLVKSLEKSEKRNFKLYVKRNTASEDLKIIQLFDALDKLHDYDEEQILKKNKSIKKQQLSNMKAHLYKQILSSLRLIKDENNIDIQLHEQMDYARILFNKGLYLQSLKVLDKMKEMAKTNSQFTYLQQALFFEKKIEGLFITRSMREKADELSRESDEVNCQLSIVNKLSNLSLQLYSWYITHGHARSTKEAEELKQFLENNLPTESKTLQGFYERLYLYQSYCWYAFIRQDFLQYYRYTQKWVDLFEEYPHMYDLETAHYIKGIHNLMGAHFDLRNTKKLQEAIEEFEKFSHRKVVKTNDINHILVFVYLTTARINSHFLEGTFSEGLKLVPYIEEKLKEYELYLDRHRVLVFYYKIASLYFGAGKSEKAIEYLNKIINWKVDLRTDLQCYARLLHLIAHYELGNFDLLEYLTKSVYRFMSKMESLSAVEEEMFNFLRRSFRVNAHALRPEFEKLLEKLRRYENNPLETRAFSYLDVISWLESKINNVPVQNVIREKYLKSKKK
jgi:tetratricopeptide (TPR) repeat protein